MLEVLMSVRPDSLATSEGTLISISISVQPSCLESLLEALAGVSFPVNPQIYHDAAIISRYPDGREERESTTLVEFPGYAGRVDEVRHVIASFGFEPECIHVIGMMDEIHSDSHPEPVPPGAEYLSRYRVKRRAVVTS
jgi:hypothetical protein